MLTWLKTYFLRRRIIKYRGKFIPQILTFVLGWRGVGKDFLWTSEDNWIQYCSFDTFEEAEERYYQYKELQDEKKKINKIKHKKEVFSITPPEPKFWRILKTPTPRD